MRIIKNIFLIFLALGLIACTGVFILFQTLDTDQYLPKIVQKVSLDLGRPVSIGHLGLGLSLRGITLDAGPLIVADDPDFTTQPFIEIDRVRVSFDLGSLIFEHRLQVSNVILESPQIHFIRSEEGDINIKSIFQNAHFVFRHPETISTVNESVVADGVKPRQGGDSSPERIARNDAVNIRSIIIQNAVISYIDQSERLPLDIWLKSINAGLIGFSSSKPFRFAFAASLLSKAPNVHANVLLSWDPSKKAVGISYLSLHADLSRLDMDQLKGISPGMADNPVFKDISGVMQLNIPHLGLDPSGNIMANGDLTITGGVIKDFNVVKILLSHTLGAFGMGEKNINNLLGGPLKDTLGQEDTIIEKAKAQISLHDKAVFIDDSLIKTNILEFTAKGSMDRDLKVDMQTMLHLNADVSAALVNELAGSKYLCDDSGRIAIGASLQGIFPHLRYKPNKDFRKKSMKALMQEGGNILGILLGGGSASIQDHDDPSSKPGKKKKKKFKDIFKNILQ